jgi:hypothetical protein
MTTATKGAVRVPRRKGCADLSGSDEAKKTTLRAPCQDIARLPAGWITDGNGLPVFYVRHVRYLDLIIVDIDYRSVPYARRNLPKPTHRINRCGDLRNPLLRWFYRLPTQN